MRVVGVIPSRYGSTRFPGKPLAKIKGQYLVERVWRSAIESRELDAVIVATDDNRIASVIRSLGGCAVLTSKNCESGTDRLSEVARRYEPNAGVFLNIQGDEPLMSPKTIDKVARALKKDRSLQAASAAYPLKTPEELKDPNAVKVILDKNNFAIYFSRYPLPYPRNEGFTGYLKHLGIYGYRRNFLLGFSKWAQTPLEKTEQLEQLRILENGKKIKIVISDKNSFGVDVKKDIKRIERYL
jgi:3-deoxy-manno-octulosonate cytidylyltransferase (CMP-KDO synthetase)